MQLIILNIYIVSIRLLNLIKNEDSSISVVVGVRLALIYESKIHDWEKKKKNCSTLEMHYAEESIKGVILEKLRLGQKQISENVDQRISKQYSQILDYFQVLANL